MKQIKVISLGGSIVAPDKVDTAFLARFYAVIRSFLEDENNKVVLVCGGGGPAREYQSAFRNVYGKSSHDAEDWIGIAATRLNGALLRHLFRDFCDQDLVVDPTTVSGITSGLIVAAGWKPGFSTDYDAVVLAERLHADTVINLSNIEKVYTDDPKKNPAATPIDSINWEDFRKITGDTWVPGKNVPFDPIATAHAAKLGLKVIFAAGKNIGNLEAILYGRKFVGTVIGPE
jgi:uridylate kinase